VALALALALPVALPVALQTVLVLCVRDVLRKYNTLAFSYEKYLFFNNLIFEARVYRRF